MCSHKHLLLAIACLTVSWYQIENKYISNAI